MVIAVVQTFYPVFKARKTFFFKEADETVYQVLVDVFSTTPSSFRFLCWWTFFGGLLVSHFFGGHFLVDVWLVIFFGGRNLNDRFLTD